MRPECGCSQTEVAPDPSRTVSDLAAFTQIMAYACLPAAGSLIGAILAEFARPPRWVIGAALHGAAGIAVALIIVDLMPRVLTGLSVTAMLPAFLAGALASLGLAYGIRGLYRGSRHAVGAFMVYGAIGADLFADGLVTGAGSAAALSLGLLLAASQLVANIPGGYAAGANLHARVASRRVRLLTATLITLPIFISATGGYFLLREASQAVQSSALAFIIGLLMLTTIEDMVAEGDAPRPPRWSSTLAFAAGFVGLALVSSYMG